MGALLKVRVGGSRYLCKWDSNFVAIGGRKYRTVKIGNQIWMAENLDYEVGSYVQYTSHPEYGLYYSLASLDAIQNSLPSGWRIPTETDFNDLISFAGGNSIAGKKLKSTSGWLNNGNGTDDYGFNAEPYGRYAGAGGDGFGTSIGYMERFASITESGSGSSRTHSFLNLNTTDACSINQHYDNFYLNIRLVSTIS